MPKELSAERIRETLDDLGWSCHRLAIEAHVSKTAICFWLRGTRFPKYASCLKIAEATRVNPEWLYGYDVGKHDKVRFHAAWEDYYLQDDG